MIGSSVSRRTEEVFYVLLIVVFVVAKAGVLGQDAAENDDDGDGDDGRYSDIYSACIQSQ